MVYIDNKEGKKYEKIQVNELFQIKLCGFVSKIQFYSP